MWLLATDVEMLNLAHVVSLKLKPFAGTSKWSLYALMDKVDQTQTNRALATFPDQESAAVVMKEVYEAIRSGELAYRLDTTHHAELHHRHHAARAAHAEDEGNS